MNISYRADWQPDLNGEYVDVYYAPNLAAARRKARAMSRKHDIAYVVARDDKTKCDLGQIVFVLGEAQSRGFEA